MNYRNSQSEVEERRLDLENAVDEMKKKIDDDFKNKAEVEASANSLRNEIERSTAQIKAIDNKLASLEEQIVKEAVVIATTLTKTYTSSAIYSRNFDVLVTDEASMAPLPALFFASCLSGEKSVVVGDFRQLAPIAQADTDIAEKWLRRDIFDQAEIIDIVNAGLKAPNLAKLRIQFRMHPRISSLANAVSYRDHPLVDDPCTEKDISVCDRAPSPGSPVVLYNTSSINPWCSRHRPGWSRFNVYTAVLAAELASIAANEGTKSIGIITPYSAQARLIHRIIEGMTWDSTKLKDYVQVSTVHRFQGMEKNFIIFDLVDGPGAWKVGILLRGGFGSDAMRLLNVAITRPKGKLAVIANYDYLVKRVGSDQSLCKLLTELEKEHTVVDSSEILSSYLNDRIAWADELLQPTEIDYEPEETTAYNQSNFYAAFLNDVRNAEKQVVILSPFVTGRRLDTIISTLRSQVDKGVSVNVVTKAAKEQSSLFGDRGDLIEYMKESGIHVAQRKKMHEKIAFIDNKIFWSGSLNILSHKDTSEHMLRMESKKAVAELKSLIRIDEILGWEQKQKKINQFRDELVEKLRSQLNETCEEHDVPMTIKFSRYGPFLSCPSYPNCNYKKSIPKKILEIAIIQMEMACEECGKPMAVCYSRKGGLFLGCSGYPECKHTRQF